MLAFALAASGESAVAADGAFEINQACVDTGCFPGDTPGFPVTLAMPGSYAMTSDLTVPDTDTTAVVVSASDVTIEMNGFRIVGPITCSGTPTTCTPDIVGGGATGIDGWSFDPTNLTVRNGSITGMGTGLLLSYDGRAEKIKALQNGYVGITARSGAAVVDSVGTANEKIGIEAALMEGCVASRNPQFGFASTGSGSVIRNSIATGNTGYGVYLAQGANVSGLSASGNDIGIYSNGASQIVDSTFNDNTHVAITNAQGTIAVGSSRFSGNNSGGLQWGGIVVELAPNLCQASTTCP
jgi:hypothetical protein